MKIVVKDNIPSNVEQNTIISISTRNVNPFTHGFHKYPAKFIPQVPRWAINKYMNGDKRKYILDPFCGSGTTLVEGIILGYNVIGVDIDPLSAMISKVKITKVNAKLLLEVSEWLKKEIKKRPKGTFSPDCETIDHWFTKDAIKKLSLIRTLIDRIPDIYGKSKSVKDIKDLLIVCFSSIIRKVSNADNESQKTYVSHTNVKAPEEVLSLFETQLNLYVKRSIEYSELVRSKGQVIQSSSSTSISAKIKKNKIDLIVTSPPYIKAIDYIYNQMVELFWVGDLFQMQTQSKQNQKKKLYIGNKQIGKQEYVNYSPFQKLVNIEMLDSKLQKIFETDKKNGHKHSFVTYKYFTEMENHFVATSKLLKKNGHYVMVVGDSTVSDIFVNTAEILVLIAQRNGYKLINKWGYEIKNRFMRFDRKGRGGIIEIDWVLEFIKT